MTIPVCSPLLPLPRSSMNAIIICHTNRSNTSKMNTHGRINSSLPLLFSGFYSFFKFLSGCSGVARCGTQLGRWMWGKKVRQHVLTAPLKRVLKKLGSNRKIYTNKFFSNKHFSFQKSGNILSKSQSDWTRGQLDWLW